MRYTEPGYLTLMWLSASAQWHHFIVLCQCHYILCVCVCVCARVRVYAWWRHLTSFNCNSFCIILFWHHSWDGTLWCEDRSEKQLSLLDDDGWKEKCQAALAMGCLLSTCFQPPYSPTKQMFILFCVSLKPYYYYWVLKCRAIMTNLCSEQWWKKQCVQCHHGCTSSPCAWQTAAVRKGRVDAVLNSSSWLSASSSTTPKACLHLVHQVILLIMPATKHIKINKQQIFIIKARRGEGAS